MNIYVTTSTRAFNSNETETIVRYTVATEEESIAYMQQCNDGIWYAYDENGGWSQGSRESMDEFIRRRISHLLPANSKIYYVHR